MLLQPVTGLGLYRFIAISAVLLVDYAAISGVAPGPPYAPSPNVPSLTATFPLLGPREYRMPIFGLGVYMSPPGEETENAVRWALDLGYRMVDTANIYKNEQSVGKAMRDSGVPRADIFLTTKLWKESHGYEAAQKAVRESLRLLEVDYLDLYLIHTPGGGKLIETWDAFVEMQGLGIVRSIGVSNFGIPHLEALEKHDRPLPAVNQIELHPLNWKARQPLLEWCKQRGIIVQAYGSMFFGKGERLAEGAVSDISVARGRTPAQVLLRWAYQMGFQIIPKSVRRDRLQENSMIFDFELSEEEMASLSAMEGQLDAYWNPLTEEVDLGETTRQHSAAPQPSNGVHRAAGEDL